MAFVANDNQQLTLTDSTFNLTQREKRVLEKSWAKTFAEKVFPAIDESIFSVFQHFFFQKSTSATSPGRGNKNKVDKSTSAPYIPHS